MCFIPHLRKKPPGNTKVKYQVPFSAQKLLVVSHHVDAPMLFFFHLDLSCFEMRTVVLQGCIRPHAVQMSLLLNMFLLMLSRAELPKTFSGKTRHSKLHC